METLPDVPMDWEPEITPVANVDVVNFGDGYEQRRANGINHVKHQASLSWSRLKRDEFNQLYPFLLSRLKVMPFLWTAPGDNEPKRWVCDELTKTRPNAVLWAVTAQLREVPA